MQRRQLLGAAFILPAVSMMGSSPATGAVLFGTAEDFMGEWKNVDRKTKTIKRITFSPPSSFVGGADIQVYGKCGSGECKWQKVTGTWLGPQKKDRFKVRIPSKHQGWTVYAHRHIEFLLESYERMHYQMLTDFVPGDGRKDYYSSGTLKRI
jgi:hypothetical protein